jgi:hypothetical protein
MLDNVTFDGFVGGTAKLGTKIPSRGAEGCWMASR